MAMRDARGLVWIGMMAALVGCGAAPDDDLADGEVVSEREDAATHAWGTVFDTGSLGLTVRKAPTTTSSALANIANGKSVGISCQTTGQTIRGTSVWNFLGAYGGYVSDGYL